jgi:hypothetical protein
MTNKRTRRQISRSNNQSTSSDNLNADEPESSRRRIEEPTQIVNQDAPIGARTRSRTRAPVVSNRNTNETSSSSVAASSNATTTESTNTQQSSPLSIRSRAGNRRRGGRRQTSSSNNNSNNNNRETTRQRNRRMATRASRNPSPDHFFLDSSEDYDSDTFLRYMPPPIFLHPSFSDSDEDEYSDYDIPTFAFRNALFDAIHDFPAFIGLMSERLARNGLNHFGYEGPKKYVEVARPLSSDQTPETVAESDKEAVRNMIQQQSISECSICQDSIDANIESYCSGQSNLVITPCGHVFHASCLHEWLENNNTCPLCRHELLFNVASFEHIISHSITVESGTEVFSYDENVFKKQLDSVKEPDIVQRRSNGTEQPPVDIPLYEACLRLSQVRVKNILSGLYILLQEFKKQVTAVEQEYKKYIEDFEADTSSTAIRNSEDKESSTASEESWEGSNVTNLETFQKALQYKVMKKNLSEIHNKLLAIEKKYRIRIMSRGLNSVNTEQINKMIWTMLVNSLTSDSAERRNSM